MTDRTYSRAQNTFMIVAGLSALLFDFLPQYRLIVGSVAVLAAIGSIMIYFQRHWYSASEIARPKLRPWCGSLEEGMLPEARSEETPRFLRTASGHRIGWPSNLLPENPLNVVSIATQGQSGTAFVEIDLSAISFKIVYAKEQSDEPIVYAGTKPIAVSDSLVALRAFA